jgi:hypothetical protein
MSRQLEVHQIPSISLSHITKEVNDRLEKDGGPWCACAQLDGCGFFLYLDEPQGTDAEPVPQCLTDIRDWRMELESRGLLDNSRWVRLDCDSDPVEGLATYKR